MAFHVMVCLFPEVREQKMGRRQVVWTTYDVMAERCIEFNV